MAVGIPQWQLDEWRFHYPDLLECDGFGDALIGLCELNRDELTACLIYDLQHCIDILMDRDRMDRDAAEEYLESNVLEADAGPHTPLFVEVVEWADEAEAQWSRDTR